MNTSKVPRILIIGIGNVLRGDEAVGSYVCEIFEKLHLPGIFCRTEHQLDPTLVEDLLQYDRIVIIDASLHAQEVEFYPMKANRSMAVASSHHVNAQTLRSLAVTLYNRKLAFFICEVGVEGFDMGRPLSDKAKANAHMAVGKIHQWITEQKH